MADVFNKTPTDFVDLNELFPVLNSAVGLTYEQFRILVENTFWLKNREEIGIVKAYIVSGSSEFGALWLSETDGGAPLVPNPEYIYIVQTNGNFKNKIFSWNGSIYEQLAKDSDNNYTNSDKSKVDKLITNGDGTKYLANDGIYKTISGGGIPEAPSDGKQYNRKDGSWVKASRLESDDGNSIVDAQYKTIRLEDGASFFIKTNRQYHASYYSEITIKASQGGVASQNDYAEIINKNHLGEKKYKFTPDSYSDDDTVARIKDIEMAITGFLNNGEIEV